MSIETVLRNTVEVVERGELEKIMERGGGSAYIGVEPSGLMHIGFLICAHKIKDLIDSGFKFTVLLADWHAYINDKFNGDFEAIRLCGEYIKELFCALEVRPEFVYASDIVGSAQYWEKVVRIAKCVSLARIRRAMTIMGRSEDEEIQDAAKYLYPAMQVADIFHLGVDVALGGVDQRRAHMLARDVAEKLGWAKPVALHTPVLSSLRGGERMNFASKMSKSDPGSCVFVHDSQSVIRQKITAAYCPRAVVEGNPVVEIWKYIIFPIIGRNITIERAEKFGGDLVLSDFATLEDVYRRGELHPADLKAATAFYLDRILSPIRAYYEKSGKNYKKLLRIIAAGLRSER